MGAQFDARLGDQVTCLFDGSWMRKMWGTVWVNDVFKADVFDDFLGFAAGVVGGRGDLMGQVDG